MNSHESIKDTADKLSAGQSKYSYYLIALSASAIGFSLNSTVNQALTTNHAILGFAILLWAVCIFLGLFYNRRKLNLYEFEYFSFLVKEDTEIEEEAKK